MQSTAYPSPATLTRSSISGNFKKTVYPKGRFPRDIKISVISERKFVQSNTEYIHMRIAGTRGRELTCFYFRFNREHECQRSAAILTLAAYRDFKKERANEFTLDQIEQARRHR